VQLESGPQHWLPTAQISLVSEHLHAQAAALKVVPAGQSVLAH